MRKVALTFLLFLSINSLAFAETTIDLPKGKYSSQSKYIIIDGSKFEFFVSDGEIIKLTAFRGIGPTLQDEHLYRGDQMDVSNNFVGNCKKQENHTCFFEVTQQRVGTDGLPLENKFFLYEIFVVKEKEILNVTFDKSSLLGDQEPVVVDHWQEDFYLVKDADINANKDTSKLEKRP